MVNVCNLTDNSPQFHAIYLGVHDTKSADSISFVNDACLSARKILRLLFKTKT